MFDLVLYCVAVIVGLLLFWYYDPDENSSAHRATLTQRCSHQARARAVSLMNALGISKDDFIQFTAIGDKFNSTKEISDACRAIGLGHIRLVVGIDLSASNEWQGRKTFGGNSLHKIASGKSLNPYQKVLSSLTAVLEPFVEESGSLCSGHRSDANNGEVEVNVFGFGMPDDVFYLGKNGPCQGFKEVLECYSEAAKTTNLKGPTSLAPLIHRVIEMVRERWEYTLLVLITDGQIGDDAAKSATTKAIIEASNFPISIVAVGVGDGPFDMMQLLDDYLPRRKFDNFQFVDYHQVTAKSKKPEIQLSLHMLMEIPDQYRTITRFGFLATHLDEVAISDGLRLRGGSVNS